MAITQSKFGRRFDAEFKREVVTLANRPGASDTQVARDLGVSPYSVGRWKKLYGSVPTASALGVSVAEMERRIRSLERENADLRHILSLNRSTGFLRRASLFQADLLGLHPRGVRVDAHHGQRFSFSNREFLQPFGDRQRFVHVHRV